MFEILYYRSVLGKSAAAREAFSQFVLKRLMAAHTVSRREKKKRLIDSEQRKRERE